MELRRFLRRAALRGGLAAGLTTLLDRKRAGLRIVPLAPAAAAAFVAGAAIEVPVLAAPGAALVAAAAVRSRRGGSTSAAVAAGIASGAAVAIATRQSWPVAPTEPADVTDHRRPTLDAAPTGKGITIAVNPNAGPARSESPTEALREALPDADVIELEDPGDLPEVLKRAGQDARPIGVAGGDGSINCAAGIAAEAGTPLVVVPAGTLNHLACDLGLSSVDDTIEAVQAGAAMEIDLPTIDGRQFLNTALFGAYTDLVDAREQLEDRIGKWPAMLIALIRVLRTSEPCEVELDGTRRKIWMAFIGNCRYHPSGFAPSWRERLDDGVLDIRLLDGTSPFSRTRLVLALLTGRLARTAVYEQVRTTCMEVRSCNGPLRLAVDGETFDGSECFMIEKTGDRLVVYVPER